MTDHAVFIPTTEGPVGGIVSEPAGERKAGMILLQGYGRPARSGTNAFWTRLARRLAERGLVVLRVDYSREGETLPIGEQGGVNTFGRSLDAHLLIQVLPWFRGRLDGLDLLLAGSCSGGRGVLELAGRDYPDDVAGAFLLVPHMAVLKRSESPRKDVGGGLELGDSDAVDPTILDCFRTILARRSSWILVGEHDSSDIDALRTQLGPAARDLEVEVVPGTALHFLDQPEIQEEAARRLLARVDRALAAPRSLAAA